jgi:hypothetical protein
MNEEWDVIVCGGGTAGATAAIKAGRLGAKTLVVERYGTLGGSQTHGWVTPLMPNQIGDHQLSRGLNLDILAEQFKVQPFESEHPHGASWYDPTALGLVLDRLADAAGVTCLFDACITRAQREGRRLSAVDVATRGGSITLRGKTFIDCTGDADLSRLAGAELMSGNDEGVHQPMSLRFAMGNVDFDRLRKFAAPYLIWNKEHVIECGCSEATKSPIAELVAKAVRDGVLEEGDLGYFQFFTMNGRPGELAFNTPRVADVDPLDPFAISRGYQIGRSKVFRIAEFMRRYWEGCEDAYVSVIAPMMGIRESRRVVGEYVLTEDDHQAGRKFDDVVARNRYPVDIHLKDGGTDCRTFPPGQWQDIPYRCLVVKGFDNLWVGGRCVSSTFVAQSSLRIIPVCRATGEAAGAAAALAVRHGCTAQALPYGFLGEVLDLAVPVGAGA